MEHGEDFIYDLLWTSVISADKELNFPLSFVILICNYFWTIVLVRVGATYNTPDLSLSILQP